MRYYSPVSKEGNSTISNNMGEAGDYNAQ
jgi:hypothetical protein